MYEGSLGEAVWSAGFWLGGGGGGYGGGAPMPPVQAGPKNQAQVKEAERNFQQQSTIVMTDIARKTFPVMKRMYECKAMCYNDP